MLASRPSDFARVAKVFDRKISNRKICNHSNLKILSPKQMLQTLITNSTGSSKSR